MGMNNETNFEGVKPPFLLCVVESQRNRQRVAWASSSAVRLTTSW